MNTRSFLQYPHKKLLNIIPLRILRILRILFLTLTGERVKKENIYVFYAHTYKGNPETNPAIPALSEAIDFKG